MITKIVLFLSLILMSFVGGWFSRRPVKETLTVEVLREIPARARGKDALSTLRRTVKCTVKESTKSRAIREKIKDKFDRVWTRRENLDELPSEEDDFERPSQKPYSILLGTELGKSVQLVIGGGYDFTEHLGVQAQYSLTNKDVTLSLRAAF